MGGDAHAAAGDDVGFAVACDIASAHIDAAKVLGCVGVEALLGGAGCAIEHAYIGRAARSGAGDDLGLAIAVHIARGDTHTAEKLLSVGVKRADHGECVAIEHQHMGGHTGARAGDEVGHAVTVDITLGHGHGTQVTGPVRRNGPPKHPVGVEYRYQTSLPGTGNDEWRCQGGSRVDHGDVVGPVTDSAGTVGGTHCERTESGACRAAADQPVGTQGHTGRKGSGANPERNRTRGAGCPQLQVVGNPHSSAGKGTRSDDKAAGRKVIDP